MNTDTRDLIPERGPLLSVVESAGYLATSTRTLEREIAAGRIPVVRVGHTRRILRGDLDAYIERGRG